MAQGESQCVRRIQKFVGNFDAKRILRYAAHLLLGCRSVAAYGYLRLSRGVFVNLHPLLQRRHDGGSLSPAELEYHLRVAAVERRLDCKEVWTVEFAERFGPVVDYPELLVGRVHLAQVEDSHVHILRLQGGVHTQNPETEYVGSGIYAYDYCPLLNQFCRIRCRDEVFQGL